MRNSTYKRGWRNIVESKPVLTVLALLLCFFVWVIFGVFSRMEETVKNRQISENKVNELQKQKAELSEDITKLESENGQEEIIREKYGLAKNGEGLIVVVDDKPTTAEASTTSGGFWGFLKKWFR